MSAAEQGPWHASALRTHGADPSKNGCDIGAANGANIAIALHQSEDRSERETIANARLIAASPDLLAQLIYLRDCIETGVDPAMSSVNAAIAKATESQQP